MAYNDTSQEFLNSLTKENCPQRLKSGAIEYQKNPNVTQSEDMKRVYKYIIEHILDGQKEERTTDSKKTETKVSKEPKYEESWEDEVVDEEEARNLRVHTRVADEYGDMKEQPEEEE